MGKKREKKGLFISVIKRFAVADWLRRGIGIPKVVKSSSESEPPATSPLHTVSEEVVKLQALISSILPPTTVPQWGAADAEIKVPSGENTDLKRSPFKAWSRSAYSHTC